MKCGKYAGSDVSQQWAIVRKADCNNVFSVAFVHSAPLVSPLWQV